MENEYAIIRVDKSGIAEESEHQMKYKKFALNIQRQLVSQLLNVHFHQVCL